jgi:hypothetical protein
MSRLKASGQRSTSTTKNNRGVPKPQLSIQIRKKEIKQAKPMERLDALSREQVSLICNLRQD